MTPTQAQLEAINSNSDNIAVASGAGSGKTFVLVERAKRLVAENRVVILITFTNRAAGEMKTRMGKDAEKVRYCGPLHKFCFRLLRNFGYLLGYESNSIAILPEHESKKLLKQTTKRLGLNPTEKELREKNTSDSLLVWDEYTATLKENNVVDFDRILACANKLLFFPQVRDAVRCDDLLIEEAQDSAPIDWIIYDAIPAARKFVVADVDQSIFAFRGGYPHAFVELAAREDFQLHRLEMNFRSDVSICTAAESLIRHNEDRVPKMILPATEEAGEIEAVAHRDAHSELAALCHITSELMASHVRSCAVLCRTNFEAKRAADYLEAMGIQIAREKIVHLPQDWELAMTGVGIAADPMNDILVEHLFGLLGEPPHRVEELRLTAKAARRPLALYLPPGMVASGPMSDVAHFLRQIGVSEMTTRGIMERKLALGADATLSDLVHDLRSYFRTGTEEGEDQVGEASESREQLYVGTIHSAKGHEWDYVFLPAFEEGIIPHLASNASIARRGVATTVKEIEEERRLAYVAVTRARHGVFISTADTRTNRWGPPTSQWPSRFIKEMGLEEKYGK